MKKIVTLIVGLSIALMASDIKVEDAYVRATPPGLPNSASFMKITNNSNENISLVSVKSSIAKAVEIHTHDMKNGMMKMYQVPSVAIKANSTTTFKPGGFHIMFLGLIQKPLKVNQMVDLELTFSNNEKVVLSVPVKSVMNGMKKMSHTMNHNMKNNMDHKMKNKMSHGGMNHKDMK